MPMNDMSVTTEVPKAKIELETWVEWAVPNTITDLNDELITQWAERAYFWVSGQKHMPDSNELSIRIADKSEVQALNHSYRQKDKPTNVLSFPADIPHEVEVNLLGDIVICLDIVIDEARTANKSALNHFAHMVIHGVLHLCGYDHIHDAEAEEMEALEVSILEDLLIANPYKT